MSLDGIFIGLGRIKGWSLKNVYFFDDGVGQVEKDITGYAGNIARLRTAEFMDLVSDDAADSQAGAGARLIGFEGLDQDFNFITELVNMNGTTPVKTKLKYLRVDRICVLVCGADDYVGNLGTITCTEDDGGTTQGVVNPGINDLLTTFKTIPAGKTGFVTRVFFSGEKGIEYMARGVATPFPLNVGAVDLTFQEDILFETEMSRIVDYPSAIPETADVRLACKTDTGMNNRFSGAYSLVMIDNKGAK